MKSITFVFLLTICTSLQTQAQARWELGIQLEYGRDWYDREYYEWGELPNGYIENFPSYYSRGAGFYAERVINPQFSAQADRVS